MSSSHSVTFVTAFYHIYETDYDLTKTFQLRLELFVKILQLGVPIVIFVSREYLLHFQELATSYSNLKVRMIGNGSIRDCQMSLLLEDTGVEPNMPAKRCPRKDVADYFLLMNSKIEYVYHALSENAFGTDYFAWFDFSLPYVFHSPEDSISRFVSIASKENIYKDRFLTMPGCWDRIDSSLVHLLRSAICWRFCGGFFLGDKQTLKEFYEASITHFVPFFHLIGDTLVWEVNYWAYLESIGVLSPIWFKGDHDDSIIEMDRSAITKKRLMGLSSTEVILYPYPLQLDYTNHTEYPPGDVFAPSSASYCLHEGIHYLLTRYINYRYTDDWGCIFYNSQRQIRTINVLSVLDGSTWMPESYRILKVQEDTLPPCDRGAFAQGVEDLRLYVDAETKELKMIGSNVSYSPWPDKRNRMVVGTLERETAHVVNAQTVEVEWESRCEKNWAPLPPIGDKQLFVYGYSPFYRVGYIESGVLKVVVSQELPEGCLLRRCRGSTKFLDEPEYFPNHYVGLVHYSDAIVKPPKYYHVLILLDKSTLMPVMHSEPFKFGWNPIEYCMGLAFQEGKMLFWISQWDREPQLLKVDIQEIPISNAIVS